MTDAEHNTLQSLPDDIAALRALVLATFAERDAAVSERDLLQTQNDRLRHLLVKLTRMQFGAKSERLPEEQLQLGLEALEQAIAKDEARRRSVTRTYATPMQPSGGQVVALCRRICRGSR